MGDTTKFKLNLNSGELEVEGTEEFVEKQINRFDSLLKSLNDRAAPTNRKNIENQKETSEDDNTDSQTKSIQGVELPGTLGEWMHGFKSDLQDTDKALITARYVQANSTNNDFKTLEVNNALKEQGIKLSNPSRTLKDLTTKKMLFQSRKKGKLKFLRISEIGTKHLETLKENK